jgi:hypothetical protein
MLLVFMLCRLTLVLLSFDPEAATHQDDLQRSLMIAARFDIAFIFRANLLSVLFALVVLPLGHNYMACTDLFGFLPGFGRCLSC